jgi:hypothetical protein
MKKFLYAAASLFMLTGCTPEMVKAFEPVIERSVVTIIEKLFQETAKSTSGPKEEVTTETAAHMKEPETNVPPVIVTDTLCVAETVDAYNGTYSEEENVQAGLHEELCNFYRNIAILSNDSWTVRIDEMPDGSYRYASWKDKKTTEAPDLVMSEGIHDTATEYDENEGYITLAQYIFSNDAYSYKVSWVDDYSFTNNNPKNWKITVTKNDELVLTISE